MKKSVLSLNQAYEKKQFTYYCNACGNIFLPGDSIEQMIHRDQTQLPLPAQYLYEKYWGEDTGAQTYVAQYGEEFGMAYCFLFNYSWLEDIIDSDIEPWNEKYLESYKARLHLAVGHVAGYIRETTGCYFPEECEVFVGEDTDPDGDEILLFIPYSYLVSSDASKWTKDKRDIDEYIFQLSSIAYNKVHRHVQMDIPAYWRKPVSLRDPQIPHLSRVQICDITNWMVAYATENTKSGAYALEYEEIMGQFPEVTYMQLVEAHEAILDMLYRHHREKILETIWDLYDGTRDPQKRMVIGFDMNFGTNFCPNVEEAE